MADAHKARPVSGEIMTDRAGPPAAAGISAAELHEIIDADYEILPHVQNPLSSRASAPLTLSHKRERNSAATPPRCGPAILGKTAPPPPVEGMAMLRKPDAPPQRQPASRGGPAFWSVGVGIALAAFWVSGGDVMVRRLPLFADTPQAAAFTLSGVNSRVDVSGAKPLLFVDGEAANDGDGTLPLPPLEIRVTGEDGRVTRYTLGTAGRALAPGERFAFSSRLDLPKNGVRTVSVAFAE
jgi:hypothetical protein